MRRFDIFFEGNDALDEFIAKLRGFQHRVHRRARERLEAWVWCADGFDGMINGALMFLGAT